MIKNIISKLIKLASWPAIKFNLGERMGGTDKFLHFEVCLILSMILYGILKDPLLSIIITMTIGVIKEIYDKYKKNPTGFDLLDLFWDLWGSFLGVILMGIFFL